MSGSSILSKLHVLIVDDDLMLLDMVAGMLATFGITQVLRADSGAHALDAVVDQSRPVDCVISDYKMSNGSGLALLKNVRMGRAKFLRADSCFILLTGSGDTDVVKLAARLDVNGYLIKPVSAVKLQATLERARAYSRWISRSTPTSLCLWKRNAGLLNCARRTRRC